jgi:hypothetical protein
MCDGWSSHVSRAAIPRRTFGMDRGEGISLLVSPHQKDYITARDIEQMWFQRRRAGRTAMTVRATRSATWAGVRRRSVRSKIQRACQCVFSTGCGQAR